MIEKCKNPTIDRDWALPIEQRAWLHTVELTGEWPTEEEADDYFLNRVNYYIKRPWILPGERCKKCEWLGVGKCTARLVPSRDYLWIKKHNNSGDCMICMGALKDRKVYQCGVCKTSFHYKCRKDWSESIVYERCPVCKQGTPFEFIFM